MDILDENRPQPPNTAPINPERARQVAVAIKGGGTEGKPDSLPKVIASGYGKLAEQILDLAFDKGIRVREDADLAELLAMLDLDTPIPSEAVVAVAEILARVYQANMQAGAALPEGRTL
ncbi:MAG: EscU/YscU/HrcU family type III secretion system export apparatus switch protein [Alphaproteobacteria bacterium]|nr:EscU/YscU/HrcU family type III secretion system export apparatus switch protein [Alphaproteobacteria bacterium]